FQLRLHFFALAFEEAARGEHLLQVLLTCHVADAWSSAEFQMAIEAMLVILLAGSERAAAPQVELPPNQLQRVAQRARVGKRPEVARPVFLLQAREREARNGIIEIYLQEQEALIVPKADVIARMKFLDQLAFQQDRFSFAAHHVYV